jgi:hypothetical protein
MGISVYVFALYKGSQNEETVLGSLNSELSKFNSQTTGEAIIFSPAKELRAKFPEFSCWFQSAIKPDLESMISDESADPLNDLLTALRNAQKKIDSIRFFLRDDIGGFNSYLEDIPDQPIDNEVLDGQLAALEDVFKDVKTQEDFFQFASEFIAKKPEALQGSGMPPLCIAAIMGNFQLAKELIGQGANVNAKDTSGRTVLFHAVPHPKILQFLIENGAGLEAAGDGGLTPLMWAVMQGAVESVKILIAAGANVEARCGMQSVMDFAKRGKNQEILKILADGATDQH